MTRTALIALSTACVLAGCATSSGYEAAPPLTPLSRYSLMVEPGVDRIALAVREDGVSPAQRSALADLAYRYAMSGNGAVRVEAPAGDDPISSRHAYAVRAVLEEAGVPADRVRVVSYAAPDPRAPVLAGFETLRAFVPNCAAEPRRMEGRASNAASIGLGCAITANMAAQIADPRDIVGARLMTPTDSGRSAVVFDNYRKGQATSAPLENLIEGSISRAVE